MNEHTVQALLDQVAQKLGHSLETSMDEFFLYLRILPDQVPAVMQTLRDDFGINYLANLTAVDYGDEFEMVYHLYGIPAPDYKIAVKCRVLRSAAVVPSVTAIYPTADWQEREVFDLMGIRFEQHPHLIRILLPEDFIGYPLRKDFKKEG